MQWEIILIALLPVPVFYLVYFRHFLVYFRDIDYSPQYAEQIESFLYGVAYALLIIIAQPYIVALVPGEGVIAASLVKAALVEKLGALAVIYLIQRNYRSFNLVEAIVSGVIFGAGFSFVENIAYLTAYGRSIILVRAIFSVPLHLVTCGLLAYYLALRNYSESSFYRRYNALRAVIIPIALHAVYDSLLLRGGSLLYFIGPMLIIMVMALEIVFAHAKTIPFLNELRAEHIRFEDWLSVYRQPRYERWISRSMGIQELIIPFFKWNIGYVRFSVIILFIFIAAALLPFGKMLFAYLELPLQGNERVLLTEVLPLSLSIIIAVVGSVNPEFIKNSIIRIPIMFDALLYGESGYDETMVTFDITPAGCFLRTYQPLESRAFRISFGSKHLRSPEVAGEVVWENHTGNGYPLGAVIRFSRPSLPFYAFLARYFLFRLSKGLFFNLRLPGFEGIRRFFVRPFSITQKIRVYQPGAVIFREGDAGNELFMIRRGEVRFDKKKESGETIVLSRMGPGEIFGEMAMLDNNVRNATAVCTEECVLAVAGSDEIRALIKYNPDFTYALMTKLSSRTNESQRVLLENIRHIEQLSIEESAIRHAGTVLLLCGLGHHRRGDERIRLRLDRGRILDSFGLNPESIAAILAATAQSTPHRLTGNGISSSTLLSKIDQSLLNIKIEIEPFE